MLEDMRSLYVVFLLRSLRDCSKVSDGSLAGYSSA